RSAPEEGRSSGADSVDGAQESGSTGARNAGSAADGAARFGVVDRLTQLIQRGAVGFRGPQRTEGGDDRGAGHDPGRRTPIGRVPADQGGAQGGGEAGAQDADLQADGHPGVTHPDV